MPDKPWCTIDYDLTLADNITNKRAGLGSPQGKDFVCKRFSNPWAPQSGRRGLIADRGSD
jgi:hypothetical protein